MVTGEADPTSRSLLDTALHRKRLHEMFAAAPGQASRRRTALDWMAVAVEEHGREIVEVCLQAMRKGDWRAAEALMSRNLRKADGERGHTHARLAGESSACVDDS
jgi:hypothetical protein